MKNKIKPLNSRLLVYVGKKDKSDGGVLLPSCAQEKIAYYIILSASPDIKNSQLKIPGVKIIAHGYSGTDIDIDGVQTALIKESDVIAIVEDENCEGKK